MSRARELSKLGNANAISVDTSNNVGLGTTTSIQYKLDVVGDANFVGVLTATSFGGDGSALTGIAATDNLNTNNIKVSGITTLGTTSTIVGSAVTFTASGGTVVGVLTATSFEGDGSSLTGVAATDYIVSNSLKVLGVSTFVGNTQLTATTASTSSATGALVVSGGVGIAGSLHVGENVSVGGTLTYEDVTNIDSVGLITAQTGVKVTAGGIDITAGGLDVSAGISTFGGGDIQISGSAVGITSVTWDASADSLIFKDNSKAVFGDGSDLSVYHDSSNSYIADTGTGDLRLRGSKVVIQNSGGTASVVESDGTGVELYYSNSKKFYTSNTGVFITGICTATSFKGDGSALTNLPSAGISTAKAVGIAAFLG